MSAEFRNFAPKFANFYLMKNLLYLIAASLLLSIFPTSASAQENGVNSPFSRYGVGLLSQQAQGFNQGMAGLAYGMRDGRELNFKNPASYSAIDSLTFLFDMGVSLQNGNFDTGHSAVNAKNVSLDYISMGYRLHRGLGMSIGLMPVSNIGYKLSSIGERFDGGITGDITPTVTYNGQGGLREAYVGVGYAPVKPLSVGVNFGYLWGSMSHMTTNSYTDANVQSVNRAYSVAIRTYDLNAGMQWHQKINNDHSFTLGLFYNLGHDIGSKSYFYNQRVGNQAVLAADTIVAHKAWSLPHSFGGGLTWEFKKSLRVGIDYTQQQWGKARQPMLSQDASGALHYEGTSAGYNNTQRITLGAEYVQDPTGLTWASRVRYRAGFSYGDSYVKIDGKEGPRSYLASIGAALPIINIYNNRTFVNVSAQYERIAPQTPGQITENYFRLCLGITFNERWFQKWKVE